MVSKHSVFYSPLIGVIAGGFLKEHGYEANYSIVPENQTVSTYLLSGEVDVAQAAVSANWSFMEQNKKINIIHFAEPGHLPEASRRRRRLLCRSLLQRGPTARRRRS